MAGRDVIGAGVRAVSEAGTINRRERPNGEIADGQSRTASDASRARRPPRDGRERHIQREERVIA